jgi:hypothetical protein
MRSQTIALALAEASPLTHLASSAVDECIQARAPQAPM